MATYVELHRGLEIYVLEHLMTIADGDPLLKFKGSTYTSDLLPGSAFLQVEYAPDVNISLGGELLDAVLNQYSHNGDVLIAPMQYNEEFYSQEEGTMVSVIQNPGYTQFFETPTGSGWDAIITYDANSTAPDSEMIGPDYVLKSADGSCIDIPRHVLLFHELCHVVFTESLPLLMSDPDLELHAISIENQYRASLGLVLRSNELSDVVINKDRARNEGLCP